MRKTLFASPDIGAVFSGRIVEHIVGQELYSASNSPLHALHFWARDKVQSNAEVDYVIPVDGRLIPIEVKSGAAGRLRSLHAFMDAASHTLAIRLYAGAYRAEKARTLSGKEFTLVNIPLFHAAKAVEYLEASLPGDR